MWWGMWKHAAACGVPELLSQLVTQSRYLALPLSCLFRHIYSYGDAEANSPSPVHGIGRLCTMKRWFLYFRLCPLHLVMSLVVTDKILAPSSLFPLHQVFIHMDKIPKALSSHYLYLKFLIPSVKSDIVSGR